MANHSSVDDFSNQLDALRLQEFQLQRQQELEVYDGNEEIIFESVCDARSTRRAVELASLVEGDLGLVTEGEDKDQEICDILLNNRVIFDKLGKGVRDDMICTSSNGEGYFFECDEEFKCFIPGILDFEEIKQVIPCWESGILLNIINFLEEDFSVQDNAVVDALLEALKALKENTVSG